LSFKADTLNIEDYKPVVLDTSIRDVFINPATGKELASLPKDTTEYNQWLSCQAIYLKDTLRIGSFFGLFSGFGFSVKIIEDRAFGNFMEYVRRDSIYRYRLKDIKATKIQVGALTENVLLSSIPKKSGDIFYGKATLVTEPFYRDNNSFQHGYIHKRYVIGVQTGNEGSTGYYVRGGGADQNLILLDGITVYNVSHLFGFFSLFPPEAVKSVELLKGGFPARYGGRLSSVLDIKLRDGSQKNYTGSFSTGILL
jgi:hypothetical protein